MPISFSPYQLLSARNTFAEPREGALLSFLDADGNAGYADCHPWTELGDDPLDSQLKWLSEGKMTALTKQSMAFARIDRQARISQKNIFEEINTPQNHYHISDTKLLSKQLLAKLANERYNFIKVKVGRNYAEDCQLLNEYAENLRAARLKIRLDFNCRYDEKNFLQFLKECSSNLDIVDFFEDPITYQSDLWQRIRSEHAVKLACDRDSAQALDFPDSCDFLVVKPAIQTIAPFLEKDLNGRRLVFTSYLDHPIGQLAGLYSASLVLKNRPDILSDCGFLTHHAYEQNLFSQRFLTKGSQLIPSTAGTGFGYDEYLENLEWGSLT